MSNKGLSFFVPGEPRPQGSVTRMPGGGFLYGKTAAAHAAVMAWRQAIERHAIQAAQRHPRGHLRPVYAGAVSVEYVFLLSRPASSRRLLPSVKPDLDKLERAVGDALEAAGILDNDSRIVTCTKRKYYADPQHLTTLRRAPGVHIIITPVEG